MNRAINLDPYNCVIIGKFWFPKPLNNVRMWENQQIYLVNTEMKSMNGYYWAHEICRILEKEGLDKFPFLEYAWELSGAPKLTREEWNDLEEKDKAKDKRRAERDLMVKEDMIVKNKK